MRTTLDIDDDVMLAVKQLARQKGQPAGRLLSDLVRTALKPRGGGWHERNDVPLFKVKAGSAIVTMELVNRLRDAAP